MKIVKVSKRQFDDSWNSSVASRRVILETGIPIILLDACNAILVPESSVEFGCIDDLGKEVLSLQEITARLSV